MPGIAGQPHFTTIQHLDTRWMKQAACKDQTDVDWFDTGCGLQAAATICYSCPVANDCLEYAVTIDVEDGIWAGLWGDQLKAMKAARGRLRSAHARR